MRSALFLLSCGMFLAVASVGHAQPEHKRVCLTAAESRKAIVSHRLIEPFKALTNARAQARAEPLASRLCRWNDDFVYEITLLKRNGKIVHVFTNAVSGKPMHPRVRPPSHWRAKIGRSPPPRIGKRAAQPPRSAPKPKSPPK